MGNGPDEESVPMQTEKKRGFEKVQNEHEPMGKVEL